MNNVPLFPLILLLISPNIFSQNSPSSKIRLKKDVSSNNNALLYYEGKHIYGISVYKDLLAVALDSEIEISSLKSLKDANSTSENVATLNFSQSELSPLLEFKLHNETSVFFCTPRGC